MKTMIKKNSKCRLYEERDDTVNHIKEWSKLAQKNTNLSIAGWGRWSTENCARVFTNGPGDLGSIPDHVIPKTLKMVLDT